MKKMMVIGGVCAFVMGVSAAHPAPPVPPNWEPILTRPGALAKGSGHLQGMCVTSNAIYGTLHDGLYKFDWYGRMIMHVRADKHTGDICFWNGKLYTAVCGKQETPGHRGRIDVWDENLKKIGTTDSCSTRTSRCSSRMCSGGGMASILWAAASRARCGSSTPSQSTAGRRRASRSSTRLRRKISSDTLS